MRLSRTEEHIHHVFAPSVPPVLTVQPGARLEVETRDASNGQIRPGLNTPVDRSRLLPVTGPIAVEGAKPGDTLMVTIERIDLAPAGHAWIRPGLGLLGLNPDDPLYVREFQVADDVELAPGLRVPLRPMVGIVGVATPSETLTRYPGVHGGNLDCVDLTQGHQLLLPVLVPGGNLSLGDVHAAMGEGEVSGSGVEIDAEVSLTIGLAPDTPLEGPVILAPHKTLFLASAPTLDQAVMAALQRAVKAQVERMGVSEKDAYMFASIAGNARICQVVNGDATVAFELPKEVLSW
ncbi:MAG: acetamidase/formamidase family protein [Desulfarculaceae bacterium]|nr:acetamidase/formamidase family protein [Desulfarculaceae bacterium]MCF8071520.1 acetamidase/formamidase family protein [Desulfarculaceae bacterium]MCF8102335.1 acetamidase/formamidase family protein [Desulfarculaceae bacterium]MCF8114799.1 acetamidase/formamidase family protein [Desulfarculaceae bacterium]